jgi:hypothetical protein
MINWKAVKEVVVNCFENNSRSSVLAGSKERPQKKKPSVQIALLSLQHSKHEIILWYPQEKEQPSSNKSLIDRK